MFSYHFPCALPGETLSCNRASGIPALELRKLGFIVEPTSAVLYLALMIGLKQGLFQVGDKVLLPLTGSGLKLIDELIEIAD